MKIFQLTAGTGSFYCGNCVRDDALVKALCGLGHEAMRIPLYLPMISEDAPEEGAPIFFGGINVYLQQRLPFFRRTPRWVDAIFDCMPLLRLAARAAGMTDASDLGEITLSILKGEEGNQSKELERLVEWLRDYGRPDVVCISNALLIGLARRIKEDLEVPVAVTLQGEDGFLDALPPPYSAQCWQILRERAREVDAFIAVSAYYGSVMQERMALDDSQVHTVHNGISLEGYSGERESPVAPTIGYLARMCPDKGLESLVRAFIALQQRNTISGLKLAVAGTMTQADLPFVNRMKGLLESAGLAECAVFMPNLTRQEKIAFLESLSVLSVPAQCREAFGLYLIEAMAAGVPVVQPNHSAFPELLKATGGGILFDSSAEGAFEDALEEMLLDSERLRALGKCGQQAVREKFSVTRMASNVLAVLERIAQPAPSNKAKFALE